MAASATLSAMPSTASKVVALVFVSFILLAGPAILLIDAISFVRTALFVHAAARTQGTIIGLSEYYERRTGRTRTSGTPSYAPVFRFTADDGQTYIVASNMFNNPPHFTIGQQVTVLYEKGLPTHANVDTFLQLWMPQLVLTIVGGGFCMLPALVIWRRIRQAAAGSSS